MIKIANELLKASIIIEKAGIEENVIGVNANGLTKQLSIHIYDPETLLKISEEFELVEREEEEYPFEIFVESEGIRFFAIAKTIPKFITEVI